jgi:hypothetical protein
LAVLSTLVAGCLMAEGAPPEGPHADRAALTVYLHRGGTVLRPGPDDPVRGESELLLTLGRGPLLLPEFPFDDAMWEALIACTRDRFRDFPLHVTDRRPGHGRYPMVVVAGTQELFGGDHAYGRMSMNPGTIHDRAVGFVYANDLQKQTRRYRRSSRQALEYLCGATAHEIGHALGLEHVFACTEVMRGGRAPASCVPRDFMDREFPCDNGPCATGRATQNSVQYLHRALARYRP